MSEVMGLLDIYFSTEAEAKSAISDTRKALQIWNDYLATVKPKRELIAGMRAGGTLPSTATQLEKVMKTELVDLGNEEKTEIALIKEFEAIEHAKELKRIKQLEYALSRKETHHEYIHWMLAKLYGVLRNEMHIVKLLEGDVKDASTLILDLRRQLELEEKIIGQISTLETFPDFFTGLLAGIHIAKRLDVAERRMAGHLSSRMKRIFANEITEGVTYEWADSVFKSMEEKVQLLLNMKAYEHHTDVDLEYANSPEFVNLVRETIQRLRQRPVSDRMIAAFVYLFRELYHESQLSRV